MCVCRKKDYPDLKDNFQLSVPSVKDTISAQHVCVRTTHIHRQVNTNTHTLLLQTSEALVQSYRLTNAPVVEG